MGDRVLVFDCHEAWVHQLRLLDRPIDILVGLSGRHTHGWDEGMRPLPPNARLLQLEAASKNPEQYACIIGHNLTDLLQARPFVGPRILMLHETLEGIILEQRSKVQADDLRRSLNMFVGATQTHVVAVSKLKGKSWGLANDVVSSCVDSADYLPWRGDLTRGLRIANHISRRPTILLWDFHRQAFGDFPVTLVGHNPDMSGVRASTNWQELKEILSLHRFYIHTADPRFEDGYNMAMLEAMAAGLPVLGNRHPTSPIVHGVSGFLSDDPAQLHSYANKLLRDRELAKRMGTAARQVVEQHFSTKQFKAGFTRSIEVARRKWILRKNPLTASGESARFDDRATQ